MTPVRVSVPARAHLAGNPSDGYGGAVLSVTVPSMSATVIATEAARFSIRGPSETWSSMDAMTADTERVGYDGGERLVQAALVTLHRELDADVERRPATFEWSTTIPRSVGLGGSSAVVLATMRAAMRIWDVHPSLDDLELARAALRAEKDELGIAAGIADRTAQTIGGVVLTDCRNGDSAIEIVPGADLTMTLAWRPAAAAPSGEYHGRLRSAIEAGDDEARRGLDMLAVLADRAATAIEEGHRSLLAASLDESLAIRRRLGPVPPAALEGVDEFQAGGAGVNFAGSGGALVALGRREPVPGWRSTELVLRRGGAGRNEEDRT